MILFLLYWSPIKDTVASESAVALIAGTSQHTFADINISVKEFEIEYDNTSVRVIYGISIMCMILDICDNNLRRQEKSFETVIAKVFFGLVTPVGNHFINTKVSLWIIKNGVTSDIDRV